MTYATCRTEGPSYSAWEQWQLDSIQVQCGRRMTSSPQLEVVVPAYVAETGSVQEVAETQILMETEQDEDLSHLTTGRHQFSVAATRLAQQPGTASNSLTETAVIRCTTLQSRETENTCSRRCSSAAFIYFHPKQNGSLILADRNT